MPAVPLSQVAVHLRPEDNVAVAARTLPAGLEFQLDGGTLHARPAASAWATSSPCGRSRKGEAVYKYGQIIGFASAGHRRRRSRPRPQRHRRRLRARLRLLPRLPAAARRRPSRATCMGYDRGDGRYGTRNYIAIISTVNCSASTSKYISERFRADRPAQAVSRTSTAWWRSRTRPAAPCSTTAPTTTSSTARWPASPSIPTWPPTSSSASAARPARRST